MIERSEQFEQFEQLANNLHNDSASSNSKEILTNHLHQEHLKSKFWLSMYSGRRPWGRFLENITQLFLRVQFFYCFLLVKKLSVYKLKISIDIYGLVKT